jgi:hypothetical protein
MTQPSQTTPTHLEGGGALPAGAAAGEDDTTRCLRRKFEALTPFLDERLRRLWAGAEAQALGRGGINTVAHATGLSRATVRAGIQDLEGFRDDPGQGMDGRRVRRPGAGRPALTDTDPALLENLENLFSPPRRESGTSPLRWSCQSTARLAGTLSRAGHRVTSRTVALLLRQLGYELRCTRGRAADKHRARNKAQFEALGTQVEDFLRRGQPVLAVDGTRTQGGIVPEAPSGRDLAEAGRQSAPAPRSATSSGSNEAPAQALSWESLTADRVLAEFAVECVRRWWRHVGRDLFADATELLLAADVGGKGSRESVFQALLQGLADDVCLSLRVCHRPPGTSKWTRTRLPMVSRFSSALPGQAPVTYVVQVSLVGDPVAAEGPATPDGQSFPPPVVVPDQGGAPQGAGKHDAWNCTFVPRRTAASVFPPPLSEQGPAGSTEAGRPGQRQSN